MFEAYLPRKLAAELGAVAQHTATQDETASGTLRVVPPVPERLQSEEAVKLVAAVCDDTHQELANVLAQRQKDRAFIDQRTRAVAKLNAKLGRADAKSGANDYATIFGQRDADGRVVVGPAAPDAPYAEPAGEKIAPLPGFLQGEHVTVFGLADDAKGCSKSLRAAEARLAHEPAIVEKIIAGNKTQHPPRWGVDFEDSQTPLRETIEAADANLGACLERDTKMTHDTPTAHLAQAFKRLPGLALPCTYVFRANGEPVPMHVLELAVHVLQHWARPEALVFYVPKLENEEEARYVATLIASIEKRVKAVHSAYTLGSVRVLVVLENARAIFRANEIADALYPYFAGASLGWHDYLAATARLYKEDPHFRIPVKADTSIVLKHVKASHELVARVVKGRGGLAIGGMYGVLPLSWDPADASLQIALRGLFKDVITQLRRGLEGFWLADPRYVRVATAIVHAWRAGSGTDTPASCFEQLVRGVLHNEAHQEEVLAFARGEDPAGAVDIKAPSFPSSLVVANVPESEQIANNDANEVRYNIFQSLQYLADWLGGNGCVGLPARVDGIEVLVLDDLATVERSRWELWAEVHHGRFALEDFIRIAHEELNAIRRGIPREGKTVHVTWNSTSSKWYPVAMELLLKFVCDPRPVDFVTELLLTFTVDRVRETESPWETALAYEPAKFSFQDNYAARFHYFFERCGAMRFARTMAKTVATDLKQARELIHSFDLAEVIESAGFHGDIGQGAGKLDKLASAEQARVFASADAEADAARTRLRDLGAVYLNKFGVKFLVSAKGKSAQELLAVLESRIDNTAAQELENAREALWQITAKRLGDDAATDDLIAKLETLRSKHGVAGASFCLSGQPVCVGEACLDKAVVEPQTMFEIASLSKTIGSAFAIEYFTARGISLDAPVNDLLAQTQSTFRIKNSKYGDKVFLWHLMSHSALNMHYVNGVPLSETMPETRDFLEGNETYGYPPIDVVGKPGTLFQYSGGGFLVLQHLIEQLEGGKSIDALTKPFLEQIGVADELTFNYKPENAPVACGYDDEGQAIVDTRKMFPSFAAGALGTPRAMTRFLDVLGEAYRCKDGSGPISHDTAVRMLHGTDKGCREFMGVLMGLGVFVGEAGPNRFAIHQGANDGFRAIYIHCFDGPDAGKSVSAFANGDNRAMFFIAEACQAILRVMHIEGINVDRFPAASVDVEKIPQEEIVNYGYKNLVFVAFEPTLPAGIEDRGPLDPLAAQNVFVGANLEHVSSQRFARACNLASDHLPKFDPELFCPMGKVMDSWETSRHNPETHDTAIFSLVRPAQIRYVVFSTKYHLGNQAEHARLSARVVEEGPAATPKWVEIVAKTHLEGHAEKRIVLNDAQAALRVDQIQIEIFPDGGLSRIGLFEDGSLPDALASTFLPFAEAKCIPCTDPIPSTKKPLQLLYEPTPSEVARNRQALTVGQEFDAASLAYGGELVSVTNQHYGPAGQVFSPYIPLSMHDGFESARSREDNHHEELVFRLAMPVKVLRVELDFTFFVNNNPREVSIEGLSGAGKWVEMVQLTPVKAFAGNTKVIKIDSSVPDISQARLKVFPDGGVNRVRMIALVPPSANI
ncbi:Malate synthase, glyoxysomal [Hondaea fermentalgiana]|uniref:Malate synthase, glyoxysomal n=1 Tax=Hondaea fermentalgiana TaxID=2315210 RepID=A0A2R5GCQ3_9STRA|nr:Malate synthase, glyoxysomal [Hondaea fermentalgiana]|eukprot:GBG28752.1 Malate synthase, glyoxysomal [Hondaea fermentalgiana]